MLDSDIDIEFSVSFKSLNLVICNSVQINVMGLLSSNT
jgi:hypothetical protein